MTGVGVTGVLGWQGGDGVECSSTVLGQQGGEGQNPVEW